MYKRQEFVEPEAAKLEELLKYDAIVVGIRAYNSNKGMKAVSYTHLTLPTSDLV